MQSHSSLVRQIVFPRYGKYLISAEENNYTGAAKAWDLSTGEEIYSFWEDKSHVESVWGVGFDRESRPIAAVGNSGGPVRL